MAERPATVASAAIERLAGYPFFDSLLGRRSRRFAPGMCLDGGPLTYASTRPPAPLTLDEQAALAFSACGITGHALAELPYDDGREPESGGGQIMMSLVGRAAASGDASHAGTVFVIDDDGAWMLRRPQDYPRQRVPELVELARARRLTELYEQARVRIGDERVRIPSDVRYTLSLNKWSANQPGTTYFLPIAELTAFYINIVLILFGEDFSFFLLDERNWFRPAGIGRFGRSRGGHLVDDPQQGRVLTVGVLETLVLEFAAVEQGGIVQNLGLMTQALGLGGFAHFAAHPWIWERELGFRMVDLPLSRVEGMNLLLRLVTRLLGRDLPMPTPVGLERGEDVLIRPFCPPYYPSMREAVLAFVEAKYGEHGTFRDADSTGAWRDPAAVRAGIPPYADEAIEAAIAYCSYVYERYGRFPAVSGPFRTALAYQACRLDLDFYERFYTREALSDTQRAPDQV
jgi:hypothetical protein